MSDHAAHGDKPERVVALPLWGIGATIVGVGLLRGRVLLMAVGAAAFFADSNAGPVKKVRAVLGELRYAAR